MGDCTATDYEAGHCAIAQLRNCEPGSCAIAPCGARTAQLRNCEIGRRATANWETVQSRIVESEIAQLRNLEIAQLRNCEIGNCAIAQFGNCAIAQLRNWKLRNCALEGARADEKRAPSRIYAAEKRALPFRGADETWGGTQVEESTIINHNQPPWET